MAYPPGADTLSRQLPFHLDDVEKVNNTFVIWKKYRRKRDKRIIDLWTYCFVRRYFAIKLIRKKLVDVTDMDILVGKVYTKIVKTHESVKDENKFASWVSVICLNHFKNHLRAMKQHVPLMLDDNQVRPHLVQEPRFDMPFIYQTVQAAISRLPPYLQRATYLRFVEEMTYREISEAIGRDVQVVRSYIHKAIQRLRVDPELLQCIEQEDLAESLDFLTPSE